MSYRVPSHAMQGIVAKAEKLGWRVKETANRHLLIINGEGKSITISDNRQNWNDNLKRLDAMGFNQLEEAVRKATLKPEEPKVEDKRDHILPQPPKRGELQEAVLDFFSNHQDRTYEVADVLSAIAPKIRTNKDSVNSVVATLTRMGHLRRMSRGVYGFNPLGPAHVPTPTPTPSTPPPTVEISEAAGHKTGDAEVDEEMRQLDEALAALGRIEQVVRKHRVVLQQLAQLKKTLAGFKL